ncbi:MAG: helix-turn-helix transcriptional regulator [Bacteroidetes bacterium]|jgi:putative transcriptional regulator|nr:helix-turn-helix transcriptional regulator [Bacteroidota bacterium]MBK8369229.1 helix-turn-helix transcriptional regulator [Bacteroidota bacterium]MBP8034174.1 helix-turn-helix transcriptional regulator [Bacteroidia bacterium]
MEKTTFTKKLGKRISKLREERKLSQVDLARLCNKPKQNINRLEAGAINPTAFYLHELSNALKVPIETLFDF